MRLLLILALVLLVAWLFRSGRRGRMTRDQSPPPTAPPGPQEMVRCAHCGVHLPRHEAVVGRVDLYCSAEHRDAAEG